MSYQENEVVLFDAYNLNMTGGVSKTLTLQRVDVSNIPILFQRIKDELPRENRSADGKQPSGELLRSGCIQ